MSQVRRLILIRHAKSDYPSGVADHDRPLNERGMQDAPAIGWWLDAHLRSDGSDPLVLVSSARRAQLTWRLASESLSDRWRSRTERTEPRIYEAPAARLVAIIDEIPDSLTTLVLVGHNPGLEDLIQRLGVVDAHRTAIGEKFPTSAIAVLSTDQNWAVATDLHSTWPITDFAIARG